MMSDYVISFCHRLDYNEINSSDTSVTKKHNGNDCKLVHPRHIIVYRKQNKNIMVEITGWTWTTFFFVSLNTVVPMNLLEVL